MLVHTARPLTGVEEYVKSYGGDIDGATNLKPPADFGFDDSVVTFSQNKTADEMWSEAMKILERKDRQDERKDERQQRKPTARRSAFVGRARTRRAAFQGY